jgi:hypothetical protein
VKATNEMAAESTKNAKANLAERRRNKADRPNFTGIFSFPDWRRLAVAIIADDALSEPS